MRDKNLRVHLAVRTFDGRSVAFLIFAGVKFNVGVAMLTTAGDEMRQFAHFDFNFPVSVRWSRIARVFLAISKTTRRISDAT